MPPLLKSRDAFSSSTTEASRRQNGELGPRRRQQSNVRNNYAPARGRPPSQLLARTARARRLARPELPVTIKVPKDGRPGWTSTRRTSPRDGLLTASRRDRARGDHRASRRWRPGHVTQVVCRLRWATPAHARGLPARDHAGNMRPVLEALEARDVVEARGVRWLRARSAFRRTGATPVAERRRMRAVRRARPVNDGGARGGDRRLSVRHRRAAMRGYLGATCAARLHRRPRRGRPRHGRSSKTARAEAILARSPPSLASLVLPDVRAEAKRRCCGSRRRLASPTSASPRRKMGVRKGRARRSQVILRADERDAARTLARGYSAARPTR